MDTTGDSLETQYLSIRRQSERLCEHLDVEDLNLQAICETSPLKWHLAHTTWFFETFLLKPYLTNYMALDDRYEYLFNSYYNSVGKQFPRAQRHLISRPNINEVRAYRRHVDEGIQQLLQRSEQSAEIRSRLVLGLHHEQQHQELMLTDLKYNFSLNPLSPKYCEEALPEVSRPCKLELIECSGGLIEIGATISRAESYTSFHFDNETPRHKTYLQGFAIANRLTTNAEYLEFIEDGGYQTPQWWSSDGWAMVQQKSWEAPLYWYRDGRQFRHFTLHGEQALNGEHPVCHVSLYEAHAFANWSGKRLCREQEWEHVASQHRIQGQFQSPKLAHPVGTSTGTSKEIHDLFGSVWEWTQSAYAPYPGYRPESGALGEYNGKFMMNQVVLRGGSVASPQAHIRASYRNFFYPSDRWQFSGIRLAEDIEQ